MTLSYPFNGQGKGGPLYELVKKDVSFLASVVLLPDPAVLELVSIEIDATMDMITVCAVTPSLEAPCPLCQQASSKVHSSYTRTLADLACFGQRVQWLIQVRRLFCQNAACERRIFTERLPTCAPAYARRTLRQGKTLGEVAFALGGKAGEMLAQMLGIPTSHDTLLRLLRRHGEAEAATPPVLGVDDFAWRRGQRYGTILVDHETHEVVDVLPDREAKSFLAWLKEHQGIEIINRDRASASADAARKGAPEATQVADRFHLLLNLREPMQRLLEQKRSCLPKKEPDEPPSASPESEETPARVEAGAEEEQGRSDEDGLPLASFPRDTAREKQSHESLQRGRQARRDARKERYAQVHDLHQQGLSMRTIARTLDMGVRTVGKYLRAEQYPEYPQRAKGQTPGKLDPFVLHILKRWGEGCFHGGQLYEEIKAQGYSGSQSLLAFLLADLRKTLPPPVTGSSGRGRRVVSPEERPGSRSGHIHLLPGHRRLSPKGASWLLVSPPEKLTGRQQDQVKRICQADTALQKAYELAQEFVLMVADRQAQRLHIWLDQAESSGLTGLCGFAQSMRRDQAAVFAALSSEWSNGQTEGQVHRLKLLKRQGYGRANFDLLRLRVLHASRHRRAARQPSHQKCV
jgi:transposase